MRDRRGAPGWRLVAVACLATAGGCRTYVIEGRVVQGKFGDMAFVRPDDPRLDDPAITNVRVTVDRDPDSLSRRQVGTRITDARGRFEIPVGEFGAGWMDEQWLFRAFKNGYQTVSTRQRLPRGSERKLLIIMTPGHSEASPEDWREQYERFR